MPIMLSVIDCWLLHTVNVLKGVVVLIKQSQIKYLGTCSKIVITKLLCNEAD